MKQNFRTRLRFGVRLKLKLNSVSVLYSFITISFGFLIYFNLSDSKEMSAAATNYTWVGTLNSDWNNGLNWLPVGTPSSTDNVTIGLSVLNSPSLTGNTSINNVTLNSGANLNLQGYSLTTSGNVITNSGSTLNINGGTITINGTSTFTAGNISNSGTGGSVIAQGSSSIFGNTTLGPVFDAPLAVSCSTVTLRNATFNNTTTIKKTGTTNDQSAGNNTFNGVTTIANAGSGYILMANSTRDIFNSDVTFINSGTSAIYPAYNGTNTQFNGNIIVNSTSGSGVLIGANTGTSTLADSKNISIGTLGYTTGAITMKNMTSLNTTPTTFSFPSTSVVTLGPGSTFNGDLNVTGGGIVLNGITVNGTSSFRKTGTTNDQGGGGNTFNGPVSITQAGTGYMILSNTTADNYNSTVSFTTTNTGILYPAYNGTNTQFKENITVSCVTAGGVQIGANLGTSTLASTKIIEIGSAGFSAGTLGLKGINFQGTTPQTFGLTGTSIINYGANTIFNGTVSSTSGGLCLSGATFNDSATFIKTGTTNDQGNGGNIFNGPLSITNSGTGYEIMSNVNPDVFNSTVTFTSTAAGIIYPAYNGTNSQFKENITVNSTGTGGVQIGANIGTSTLAADKIIEKGSLGFSSGSLLMKGMTSAGVTPQTFNFTGTSVITFGANSVFNGKVTSTSGGVCLSGSTFNDSASFTKNGATNDQGAGGNVFNAPVSITDNGTGYIIMSNTSADVFNYPVSFTGTAAGIIYPAYNGTNTQFKENITVSCTGAGGIQIGANNGTSTLSANKTIEKGAAGFSAGVLLLRKFTSAGVTPQTFNFTGTSVVNFGTGSVFGGDVTSVSGGVYLSGATFNGTTSFTKNGATNDMGAGGNTFNAPVSITNNGTGYLMMSNTTADIFNYPVSFTGTGTGIIYPAYNGTNTQFKENITVSCTGTGGIQIGASTGTSTLSATKTIDKGAAGFSNGTLTMRGFTFAGNTPQSFNFTGTAVVNFGLNSVFNSDITCVSGGICLSGSTFNGTSSFTKNGTTNDQGSGGNTFNAPVSITNNGSGYMIMSNTTADIFNAPVSFTCTGTGITYPAYNGTNTQFRDNVTVSSSGSGGIYFGSNTGTSTLTAGKTISMGTGFSAGGFLLKNFSSPGSGALNLPFTGTSIITFGPNSNINGDVTTTSGGLCLNGCVFNQTASFVKTGATNDNGSGNNTFNRSTTIRNNGTGFLLMANTTRDIFNSDINFINTGTGIIYPAYNDATGTQFNEGVAVSNTGTGSIQFSQSNGTSQLAAGKTISVGASGLTNGALYLRKFIQAGTTPQSISITSGTAALYLQTGTIFNGAVNFSMPQLYLNGATFNSSATLDKSGATNNTSTGGNIFNSTAYIRNTGTGIMYLANGTPDDYNGNVSFVQIGTGAMNPAYNTNCTFAGDISTYGSLAAITFGASNGTVSLDGTSAQHYDGTSFMTTMRRLVMNKTIGDFTLNAPVTISVSLNLTNGIINSSGPNLLIIGNGITTVSNVSDASYVSGPVRKVGNQAFTFPTGDAGKYRPIGILAPTLATDHFTAQYYSSDPHTAHDVTRHDPSIDHLSRLEYWDLARTNGASNIRVVLSWTATSLVDNLPDLKVSRWDNAFTKWIDHGNTSITGNSTAGTITSGTTISTFGNFTLGSATPTNALPISLISFDVAAQDDYALITWKTASEVNNKYFTIERSDDGVSFEEITKTPGAGNTTVEKDYEFLDKSPLTGTSYYRLKQTDFDGHFKIFDPVSFDYEKGNNTLHINSVGPNPFTDKIKIDFASPIDTYVDITLISLDGHTVFSNHFAVNPGQNSFSSDELSSLPVGNYLLRVTEGEKVLEVRKLLKN